MKVVLLGFEDSEDEMLTMDGFDCCIVGVVERMGHPPIICYDREKVIKKHMEEGMSYDEAEEFFEFNQIGAWVGDSTPCFLTFTASE